MSNVTDMEIPEDGMSYPDDPCWDCETAPKTPNCGGLCKSCKNSRDLEDARKSQQEAREDELWDLNDELLDEVENRKVPY